MGGMDMAARQQYLSVLVEQYLKERKKGKGALLDEYCRNTGQNRKYVIRKLRQVAFGEPRERRKRRRRYTGEVRDALARIWKIFDRPCGRRLRPLVVNELVRLRALHALRVTDAVAEKLSTVSPATIDRLLRPVKGTRKHHQQEANLLFRHIPLRMTDWEVTEVGYLEIDLVLHCGASTEGDYVSTLSTVEIGSGWWEGEAVMGRSQFAVFAALKAIRARTPFAWKGIDSDNDPLFINRLLARYCSAEGLAFTRSRPYRKNDNAYIEQKNFTHVRKPLGYFRYDTEEEREIINGLYRNDLRLYKNFFQPVMKLIRKERIEGKVKRVYDEPKTPYVRLLESGQITQRQGEYLRVLYEGLNPVALKERIDATLGRLYDTYEKKAKRPLRVNPYRTAGSSVTFFMRQQA